MFEQFVLIIMKICIVNYFLNTRKPFQNYLNIGNYISYQYFQINLINNAQKYFYDIIINVFIKTLVLIPLAF